MEPLVAEHAAVDGILTACERYWRETKVPARAAAEMKRELESHLNEARLAGKSAEAAVGPDLADFAEEWARVYRRPETPRSNLFEGKARRRFGAVDVLVVVGIIAVVAIVWLAAPKEETVDDPEVWNWIWAGLALLLGVGEMLTAGFFLLPFAIGAVFAAAASWLNVAPAVSLFVFIVVSILALVGLQRFVKREDEEQPAVGANRFMQKLAIVLEPVDRSGGTGRVRMDTELWRATTDQNDIIDAGTEVRIVDVRGTRLVVEPVDHS